MTSHLLWLSRHDDPHFGEEEKKTSRIEVNLSETELEITFSHAWLPSLGSPSGIW